MDYMVVIRAVNTIDVMTASSERIPYEVLEKAVRQNYGTKWSSVSRVCYEIAPEAAVATIEFE